MRLCHSHTGRISSCLQAPQRPLQASATSTEPESAHKHRRTPGRNGHTRQASRRARASLHRPQDASAGPISLAAIGGAASAKREGPGFRRTASLIATSTHPPSHPQLQCPGTFPNAQPRPRHFSWNFTPETRRSSLKGTQNRASTPAIAHAGLPHGAHFPRLAATATSRFAVTNGQAAPPAPSARLAAPSATAPAKAWSTRRRGIGQPNDGVRGSCFQACSAS